MKKPLSLLVLFTALFVMAKASGTAESYVIDDQKVEQLFDNSTDISYASVSSAATSNYAGENYFATAQQSNERTQFKAGGDKNFATALLLNLFLGGLGIHRLYLGTKTLTWVGYILTCGGIFGIVPLVDLITLIINNDDITPYVDNPKFFMWSGQ